MSQEQLKPDLSGFDAFDVLKQGHQALAPQAEQAKGGEPMTPEQRGVAAEYWGSLAQQKADLDIRRGVSMPVSYYASDVVGAALSHYATPAPAASVSDEREAFEAEMRCEEVWGHRSLVKRPDGRYQNWQVNAMWDVWQARAALRPAQPAASVSDEQINGIVWEYTRLNPNQAADSDLVLCIRKAVRAILALRPVQVPMDKQDAWDNSPVNSDWEAVDAYLQGIEDAEAHHGITAQAKKEGA